MTLLTCQCARLEHLFSVICLILTTGADRQWRNEGMNGVLWVLPSEEQSLLHLFRKGTYRGVSFLPKLLNCALYCCFWSQFKSLLLSSQIICYKDIAGKPPCSCAFSCLCDTFFFHLISLCIPHTGTQPKKSSPQLTNCNVPRTHL